MGLLRTGNTRTLALFFGASLLAIVSAHAATCTWVGGSGTNWSTGANWDFACNGGTGPVAGDDLVFPTTANLTANNNFAAGTLFHSLQFTGNSVLLGAGGVTQSGTNPSNSLKSLIMLGLLLVATTYLTPAGGVATRQARGILRTPPNCIRTRWGACFGSRAAV